MKVWLGGQIVDSGQARISVADHGLLYGDGVFEGIRVYGGTVFRLHDHLRRLQFSAAYIGLELPYSLERIADIVVETVRAFAEPEAYIRLVVTRGEGALGVDPNGCGPAQLICMVGRIALFDEQALRRTL